MTVEKKSSNSRISSLIYLHLSGLMRAGMQNVCGNFCWKQPSTKMVLPGTQEVIAPY